MAQFNFEELAQYLTNLFKGRALKRESTPLDEDLRRLGLVFIAGGVVASMLNEQVGGVFLAGTGFVLSYFGLTEKVDDDE